MQGLLYCWYVFHVFLGVPEVRAIPKDRRKSGRQLNVMMGVCGYALSKNLEKSWSIMRPRRNY